MASRPGDSLYSLDTSAFLNSWRKYYPPDLFPMLWQNIEASVDNGILIAVDEVLVELEKKDDEVCEWARRHQPMFRTPEEPIQRAVTGILAVHPRLVDTRRNRSGADPFVIALAQVNTCTVVTYEMPSGNPAKPHIPDVCSNLGVRCISFVQLIRELGWRM